MCFDKRRYLKQLQSLGLFLSSNHTTQSWLHDCKRKLKTDLQQLVLYSVPFTDKDDEAERGLELLSSRCLQYLENLKSLNLHFESLEAELEAAQVFCKVLNAQIKTLEHINFNFRRCFQITEIFLESFEYPENNKLKKLELQIRGESMEVCEKSMPSFISKSMPNLKNLTYLDFHFEQDVFRVEITDEHVESLVSCITQNLSKIEFIKIQFVLCPAITEASLQTFQEEFCSENVLPNLKTIFLIFSNCSEGITQEKINAFEVSLQNKRPNVELKIGYVERSKTDSSYEPSDHEKSFISNPKGHYGCWDCEYLNPCKRHRWESDNSDVNLTDFIGEKNDNENENDEEDFILNGLNSWETS